MVVYLTCFTCAMGDGGALFGVDKRTCRYWIQYPGIGSNTGQDRRLKMHGKVSGASSIFNLRSRPVLDPIPAYWIQYPSIQLQYRSTSKIKDPLEGTTLETPEGPDVLYFP